MRLGNKKLLELMLSIFIPQHNGKSHPLKQVNILTLACPRKDTFRKKNQAAVVDSAACLESYTENGSSFH